MLLWDKRQIGNRLLSFRKTAGMTQSELAEKAGLSLRSFADIERGNTTMRLDTLLHICDALHITPNDLLTAPSPLPTVSEQELFARLALCSPKNRDTALRLMSVFFQSIDEMS